jgi:hypothetical protein
MAQARQRMKYKNVLVAFMGYRDGTVYSTDTNFTDDELESITSNDLCEYFLFRAYGTPHPQPEDFPTQCRSSSLHFYKKAISSFMPNRHHVYDVRTLTGNPTRSPAVNDLIKTVKKHEVRAEGVPSQARRDLTVEEYRLIVEYAKKHTDFPLLVRFTCLTKLQINMIARIDDVSNIFANELRCHPQIDFALVVRLRWTKNCIDERSAPSQIILGAMDSNFCVLVGLGIYLQYVLEFTNAVRSTYLFCNTDETPDTVKKQVSNVLMQRVVKSNDWVQYQRQVERDGGVPAGKIGTHSLRKMGSTLARLMGRSQDEVDVRGRWRNTKRVSDRYTSITLPIVDANVAAALCVGGPAKYEAKPNSGVSDHWLVATFVPQIADKFGNRCATVLGKALLWALCDDDAKSLIPVTLANRLNFRYLQVQCLEGENPVEKSELIVYSVGSKMHIDPVDCQVIGRDGDGDGGMQLGAMSGPTNQVLMAQNNVLRTQVTEIMTTMRLQNDSLKQEIFHLKRTVGRFANRPAQTNSGFFAPRRAVPSGGGSGSGNSSGHNSVVGGIADNAATLSKCPKNLYLLWEEYEFGLQGRKPAKRFTTRERGRDRFKYNRRKIVWDQILKMIRRGHSYLTAIDVLYRIYGDNSVTDIINKMRTDRINGGHPELV